MDSESESDGLYFSTSFWNNTANEIPKEHYNLICAHITRDVNSTRKLQEFLLQRAKAELGYAKKLRGDLDKFSFSSEYSTLQKGMESVRNADYKRSDDHKKLGDILNKISHTLNQIHRGKTEETKVVKEKYMKILSESSREKKKSEKALLDITQKIEDGKCAKAKGSNTKENHLRIVSKWNDAFQENLSAIQKIEEERHEAYVNALKEYNLQLNNFQIKKNSKVVKEELLKCDATSDIKDFVRQNQKGVQQPSTPTSSASAPSIVNEQKPPVPPRISVTNQEEMVYLSLSESIEDAKDNVQQEHDRNMPGKEVKKQTSDEEDDQYETGKDVNTQQTLDQYMTGEEVNQKQAPEQDEDKCRTAGDHKQFLGEDDDQYVMEEDINPSLNQDNKTLKSGRSPVPALPPNRSQNQEQSVRRAFMKWKPAKQPVPNIGLHQNNKRQSTGPSHTIPINSATWIPNDANDKNQPMGSASSGVTNESDGPQPMQSP